MLVFVNLIIPNIFSKRTIIINHMGTDRVLYDIYDIISPQLPCVCCYFLPVKALVFGDNRPFNVALVFPDWDLIRSWAETKAGAKPGASMEELSSLEGVRNLIAGEIAMSLDGFKKYEVRLFWVVLLLDVWGTTRPSCFFRVGKRRKLQTLLSPSCNCLCCAGVGILRHSCIHNTHICIYELCVTYSPPPPLISRVLAIIYH